MGQLQPKRVSRGPGRRPREEAEGDPPRARGRSQGVPLPGRAARRVVVLAETAEHARRLGDLLPGWAVLDAVPITGEDAGWESDPDTGPPPGTVATLAYAAGYGVVCDVLVRATAGTGKLNWASFPAGVGTPGPPTLVVDFEDSLGDRETEDARMRRREYREQGLGELKAVPTNEENT